VVVIIPSSRQDLYQVIKVICNREVPIPSQVVLSKTLGDERRLRSIMQKVALQINCKLGGALWTLNIPLVHNSIIIKILQFVKVKHCNFMNNFFIAGKDHVRWNGCIS